MLRARTGLTITLLLLLLGPAAASTPQDDRPARVLSNVPHTIAGRVLDPAGRPLQGVLVVAMHRETQGGVTRAVPIDRLTRVTTNLRGEFRLLTWYRGEHYLVAFPRNSAAPGDASGERAGYGITYYPRTASATDARALVIGSNGRTTADITMVPARLSIVSGIVIGSGDQPVRGGLLRLTHGGNGLFGLDSKGVAIEPDGTFKTPGLPPGRYFLQYREGVWPVPLDTVPRVSGTMVTIADTDLTGIRVTPIAMVRVTGRLVVDAAARATLPFSTIQVGASPVNADGNPGPQRPGVVRKDLSFELRTWPGVVSVRVLLLSPGWAVKSIRLNGADITGRDIELRRDTSGLEITVVKATAR